MALGVSEVSLGDDEVDSITKEVAVSYSSECDAVMLDSLEKIEAIVEDPSDGAITVDRWVVSTGNVPHDVLIISFVCGGKVLLESSEAVGVRTVVVLE